VTEPQAEVVVVNDYPWIGDSRLGAFVVSIDRRRVGLAPIESAVRWQVTPGTHSVRIRMWRYYASPSRTVEVLPGSRAVLRANKPQGSVPRAVLLLALRPFSALSLEVDSTIAPGEAPTPKLDPERLRRRRRLRVIAAIYAAVFVTILVVIRLAS
jgi:hypothetical protein